MSRRPLGLTSTCILPPFIFVLTRSLGLPGYPIALSPPDFYVYSQIQNLLTFSAGTPGLSPASLNFSFRELQTSYVIAVSLPHYCCQWARSWSRCSCCFHLSLPYPSFLQPLNSEIYAIRLHHMSTLPSISICITPNTLLEYIGSLLSILAELFLQSLLVI